MRPSALDRSDLLRLHIWEPWERGNFRADSRCVVGPPGWITSNSGPGILGFRGRGMGGGGDEEYNVCAPNVWYRVGGFLPTFWCGDLRHYCGCHKRWKKKNNKGPGAHNSDMLARYVRVCWSMGLDIWVDSGNESGRANLHVAPPRLFLTVW